MLSRGTILEPVSETILTKATAAKESSEKRPTGRYAIFLSLSYLIAWPSKVTNYCEESILSAISSF